MPVMVTLDVDAVVADGCVAWPQIQVSPVEFRQHVLSRLFVGEAQPIVGLIHASDLYLAFACMVGNTVAVSELDRRYLHRVKSFISWIGTDPIFVDDVRQILREKLLLASREAPKIAEYCGRGSLESWLRIAAARTALNLRRCQRASRTVSTPAVDRQHATAEDPENELIRAQNTAEVQRALDATVAGLTLEQLRLFRLHFVDGLTIDEICAVLPQSRSAIGRQIISVRSKIATETRGRLLQRLRLNPNDLDSVLSPNELDVTLRVGSKTRDAVETTYSARTGCAFDCTRRHKCAV
jgi:RNA polymerase sigma-70 factor (ECF subfamily)